MRLSLGRPRAAMIVAPHPDDEVIGAANLIRALRTRGTVVHVVIVTDGAASHPDSPRWPRARRTTERRRESRRALARLGVPAGAITFLDLTDGGLTDATERCRRELARAIRRRGGIDLVVGPTAGDDHPDHRAVAAAIARGSRRARSLAYQVWPPRRLRLGRVRHLVGRGAAAGKRSIMRSYRTQLGSIRDAPAGFAIARHELDTFSHPIERFMELRR